LVRAMTESHHRVSGVEAYTRWGILSTAHIAGKFVSAVARTDLAEVSAVASRDLTQGRAFAETQSVPTAYGDYEQLLDDALIESGTAASAGGRRPTLLGAGSRAVKDLAFSIRAGSIDVLACDPAGLVWAETGRRVTPSLGRPNEHAKTVA
jgi:hypothetical protein